MKILTWNVNGLRSAHAKGFLPWLLREKPDVLCLQEIKAGAGPLPPELREVPGYRALFNPAERPGYSGTAIYAREAPDATWTGVGQAQFDAEGRVLAARFGRINVVSAYFPNSRDGGTRLAFKLEFCRRITRKLKALVAKGEHVVLAGDYNIAHEEIDLARPDANHESPGFFPAEREAMTAILASGFHDVFREAHPGLAGAYTWWSLRSGARKRNVGWRIDYANVDSGLRKRVKRSWIMPEVMGSDHCPVGLQLV